MKLSPILGRGNVVTLERKRKKYRTVRTKDRWKCRSPLTVARKIFFARFTIQQVFLFTYGTHRSMWRFLLRSRELSRAGSASVKWISFLQPTISISQSHFIPAAELLLWGHFRSPRISLVLASCVGGSSRRARPCWRCTGCRWGSTASLLGPRNWNQWEKKNTCTGVTFEFNKCSFYSLLRKLYL